MIKYVVKIQAFNTTLKTIERYFSQSIRIDMITQIHSLNMIIITCLAPEQIHTQQTAVQTQVELLLAAMIILGIDMLQVEGITQEYPSPSQIRSQAPGRIRRKGDSLPLLAIQGIFLVGIGILQHHRIVEVLRFYIPFIYIGELSKEGSEGLTQTMKESALMTGTNQTVLSITLEHRRIEKGLDER